ncbi:MAG: ribosome small subunit-dependent GTPase A [Dehalococcoidia bacterium]|nr:ribosome small subunit-dependent GTPase A [Dehalococcoidia bacterium]
MNTFSQEDNPDISESLPTPPVPPLGNIDLSGLIQFGLTKAANDQFTAIIAKDSELVPGRVTRVDGISTFVQTATVDYRAVSRFARIAHNDEFEIEPAQPTVGDWVLVRLGEDQDPDDIELVLPRISLLSRKRVMRGKEQGDEQVLASNINTVFVVQAATYFNPSRLEREIALVWGSGATPVVVITKIDLLEEGQDPTGVIAQAKESAPGVEVFAASGITGAGTESLREFTKFGITVVLIGASGVGKSTLVNLLMGQQAMETAEIRESDTRGRHTTVTRQLLRLPNGGVLIDTPGIRTIGLVSGSEDALAKTFSDVEEYMWKCRFSDCGHSSEPGCAIVEALAKDNLSQARFDSYMRMWRELQFEETKHDATGKTDHQRKMRIVAKTNRQRTKAEKRKKS